MDLPDDVYERAERAAETEGLRVEDALVRSLRAFWLTGDPGDTGLEGALERLALIAPSIESTDWWDTPEDRAWDEWQPSARAM